MLETVVVNVVKACCRRPGLTLLVASALTFGAVAYTYEKFAINTDNSQLISSKLPWRQRELQLDAAFPQQVDTLLVVVDGATPEQASGARQDFGRRARQEPGAYPSGAGDRGRPLFREERPLVPVGRRGQAHHRRADPGATLPRHARRRSDAARSGRGARHHPARACRRAPSRSRTSPRRLPGSRPPSTRCWRGAPRPSPGASS